VPFKLFKSLTDFVIEQFMIFRRALAILAIVIIISLITQGWSDGTFKDLWRDIQPQNQTYTELSFNNVSSLPTAIPSNKEIEFSFTIHNVEGKSVNYPYVIINQIDGINDVLKKGSVYLTDNGSISVSEFISLTNLNKQKVFVSLPNQKESIYFILNGSNS